MFAWDSLATFVPRHMTNYICIYIFLYYIGEKRKVFKPRERETERKEKGKREAINGELPRANFA